MQTMQIVTDITNSSSEFYSATQSMPGNGQPSNSQFNNVLKNVQGKTENSKTTSKNHESSECNSNIADTQRELSILQNASDAVQQIQTQNLSLPMPIPWGQTINVPESHDQSVQLMTIRNVETNPLSNFMSNLSFSSTTNLSMLANQFKNEAFSSVSASKVEASNGISQLVPIAANSDLPITKLGEIIQQKIVQLSTQTPATFGQERALTSSLKTSEDLLPANKLTNKFERIFSQNNQISQSASINGGMLMSDNVSTDIMGIPAKSTMIMDPMSDKILPDILPEDAKINFPISLKQHSQLINSNFTDETFTTPESLFLKDNGDKDILTFRDSISYNDILSSAKLSTITTGTVQASADIDPQNIVTQIVDQARLITSNQNSEMVIKLNPEHLGELTLKVAVNNGVVTATFHSNNSDVRNVLEASIVQFKQEMANAGVKVNYVGIYAGLDQFFSGGQHGGNSGQYMQSAYYPKAENETMNEVEFSTISQITDKQSTSVDYRI